MWIASSSRAVRAFAAGRAAPSSSVISPAALFHRHRYTRTASTVSETSWNWERKTQDRSGPSSKASTSDKRSSSISPGPSSKFAKGRSSRQFRGAIQEQEQTSHPPSYKGKQKESNHSKHSITHASDIRNKPSKSGGLASTKTPRTVNGSAQSSASRWKAPPQKGLSDADNSSIGDESTSVVTEQATAAEEPKEDALAAAQDQLRAFFSRKTGTRPVSTLNEVKPELSLEVAHSENASYQDPELPNDEETSASTELAASASQAGTLQDPEPKYSRPTLSDLQSADSDDFAGLYRSKTVWDPSKEYALMQDGPERKSFLQRALEQGPRQYIVVILDGDNLLFDPRHLNKGYEGGKFVYEELRLRIAKKHNLRPHLVDLRVRVFCALNPLATVLNNTRIVRRELLFDFFHGLSDCNLNNYVVNVGRGDQAADLRVKAALADAIRDPGCFRAYLGGLDDFGYLEELNTIQSAKLLDSKVHLVQVPGFAVKSNVYREYAHRAIDLDYLFKNYETARRDMQNYGAEAFNVAGDDSVAKSTASRPDSAIALNNDNVPTSQEEKSVSLATSASLPRRKKTRGLDRRSPAALAIE
ncbi:uncharacterized protein UTRI_01928_B [Ustilago trichophora]|uniref:DUF7923 domain-containing protein n=1 Tax=Ustilago trichophora TaxID=86804 RepID=A0A5C3DXF2_9BASI|nr:uncharacterized protein UTRI_01928_B [Ustilago trichophora]